MEKNFLPQCDVSLLRQSLEREIGALQGALRNRTGTTVETVAEECERIALAGQRDLTIELVDRASRRLREVESALRRLAEDDFGVCVECDELIPARRLAAIPWAIRCVSCQDAVDRGTTGSQVLYVGKEQSLTGANRS
jgi:DnaK suppressor protein